jgi:hypothetical protein
MINKISLDYLGKIKDKIWSGKECGRNKGTNKGAGKT